MKKEIFSFFKPQNVSSLTRVVFISLLRISLLAVQFVLLVSFLGENLFLIDLLALFGSTFAATETPISADLGSHDMANAFLFEKMGLSPLGHGGLF